MTADLEKAMTALKVSPEKRPDAKAAIWDYIDPALVKAKPSARAVAAWNALRAKTSDHAKPIARLSAVGIRKATCASTPKTRSAVKVTPKRGK